MKMPGMGAVLENLENPQNSFVVRVKSLLDSVRALEFLETESSYADMLQNLMDISERLIAKIEEENRLDETILQEYVGCYREIRKELLKYQIIFIGNDVRAAILSGLVDKERVHVLESGDVCHHIPDYCDYVMVLDLKIDGTSLKAPACSRVIRLDKILAKYDISPETAYWDKKLRQSLGSRKGYVTGLSYEQRGIIWDKIGFGLGCLAAPSQDLFVDILSYMEVYNKTKKKYGVELQYCVLGLSFYALWYDLSLSQAHRMLCFYDRIKTLHHLNIDMAGWAEDMSFCREIFAENFLDRYYERYYQDCIRKMEVPNVDEYHPEASHENDRKEIEKVFHKPYEHTFLENTGLVRRFFKWLHFHNIQTIVYIPPFPALFNEYTPDVMRERTLSFLHELQKDFDFAIFDISDERELFDNSCFADWGHLNLGGGRESHGIAQCIYAEGVGNVKKVCCATLFHAGKRKTSVFRSE